MENNRCNNKNGSKPVTKISTSARATSRLVACVCNKVFCLLAGRSTGWRANQPPAGRWGGAGTTEGTTAMNTDGHRFSFVMCVAFHDGRRKPVRSSETQLDFTRPDFLDALGVVAGENTQFSPQQILFQAIQPRQPHGGTDSQSFSLPVFQSNIADRTRRGRSHRCHNGIPGIQPKRQRGTDF